MAAGSLFAWLNDSVLRRPTYSRFCSLLDIYDPDEAWLHAQASFIEEISRTAPIKYLYHYLVSKKIASENYEQYLLHVFVGEIKRREVKEVTGFHNWIQASFISLIFSKIYPLSTVKCHPLSLFPLVFPQYLDYICIITTNRHLPVARKILMVGFSSSFCSDIKQKISTYIYIYSESSLTNNPTCSSIWKRLKAELIAMAIFFQEDAEKMLSKFFSVNSSPSQNHL